MAYVLLVSGVVLFVLGARELWESYQGQTTAEREFEIAPVSRPATATAFPIRNGDVLAKLTIPRLGAELFVMEGAGKRELRRGPGHVSGTALPGSLGNCVIAGHRDTHFRVLKDIRDGDEIVLETHSGTFRYRVRKTRVVWPEDNSAMLDSRDSVLNLITCYPFYYAGAAPKRFVVNAELDDAGQSAAAHTRAPHP